MHCVLVISMLLWSCIYGQNLKCRECAPSDKSVCGKDGNNYASFCLLKQQECLLQTEIGFDCNGQCPCDPIEVVNIDKETVGKLKNLRSQFQLEDNEKDEEKNHNYLTLDILDDSDIKTDEKDMNKLEIELLGEQEKKDKMRNKRQGSGDCPTEEMSQLPTRLIDWFHILKTNEMQQRMNDEGIEQESVLKEMKFVDSKLKAMYAELACTEQEDDAIEKQVCLSPVQWMFEHLDTNQDGYLSAVELYEIEQINREHCIKPFLKSCDSNQDEKVVLKEFCKCLCVVPPCTKVIRAIPAILLRGEPRPSPGIFTPVCNEDGFFMPTQCNKKSNECWCVDRNGAEYEGTRKKGHVNCEINTKTSVKSQHLIPLDLKKENLHE